MSIHGHEDVNLELLQLTIVVPPEVSLFLHCVVLCLELPQVPCCILKFFSPALHAKMPVHVQELSSLRLLGLPSKLDQLAQSLEPHASFFKVPAANATAILSPSFRSLPLFFAGFRLSKNTYVSIFSTGGNDFTYSLDWHIVPQHLLQLSHREPNVSQSSVRLLTVHSALTLTLPPPICICKWCGCACSTSCSVCELRCWRTTVSPTAHTHLQTRHLCF